VVLRKQLELLAIVALGVACAACGARHARSTGQPTSGATAPQGGTGSQTSPGLQSPIVTAKPLPSGQHLRFPVLWAGPKRDGEAARFAASPPDPASFRQAVAVGYGQCAAGVGPKCKLYVTTFELAGPQSSHGSAKVRFGDGETGTIQFLGYIGLFHSTLAYLNTTTRRVQLMIQGRWSRAGITRFAESDLQATSQVP